MNNSMKSKSFQLLSLMIIFTIFICLFPINAAATEEANPIGTRTIYYDNNFTKWKSVYAYYWSDNPNNEFEPSWPGIEMSRLQGKIYSYDIPLEAGHIIFNNGNEEQTPDLLITETFYDDKNCFAYEEGSSFLGESLYSYTYTPQNLEFSDIVRLFQPAPTVILSEEITLTQIYCVKTTVPILVVSLILFFVLVRNGTKRGIDTSATRINLFLCVFAWLIGVCILSITPLNNFFEKTGKALFFGSIIVYIGLFIHCCYNGDRFGISNLIRAMILCLIITPIYRAFALHISIMVGALVGALVLLYPFLFGGGSGGGGGRTKSDVRIERMENVALFAERIDKINEHIAEGGDETIGRFVAQMAADDFLETDENLRREINNLPR